METQTKEARKNSMREIRLDKVTLNIGAGKDVKMLEKGILLLKQITGIEPVKTYTNKRIPSWGLRPGLPIGCKITLRGEKAKTVLKRLFEAIDNQLSEKSADDYGNIAFGIKECIDIPGTKYDPKIGVIGLEVCVTLSRPGFRVKRRKMKKSRIGKNQIIKKEETLDYLKKEYGIKIIGKEE